MTKWRPSSRSTALAVRPDMEVVDERAPVRVFVNKATGKAHKRFFAVLGQDNDLPGSRVSQAPLP